ncbi:MAG: family 16 glycoside hydrolase, partial [Planctomycetota bacterium]
MVAGRLTVEDGADLTFISESHLDGVETSGIRPEIIMNGGSVAVYARTNMGTNKVGNGGNYAYLTMNGGTFSTTGTFKLPDDPGGESRLYLNSGIMHCGDIQMYYDRDAAIIVGAGMLRLDNVIPGDAQYDPEEWLKQGALVPAEGYDDIIIQYEGSYTEITALECDPNLASYPSPLNGAAGVDPNMTLSWIPGTYAASHDVYFGTDFDDVNDATTSWSEYKGNQEPNSYYPGPLELGTSYYWRIDEVNDNSVVHKGNIWSFQTDWAVLFEEDFEDGNADRWSFAPLYGDAEFHVEAEGDNYVLSGSGHGHANPIVDGWADYSFKSEVKFIGGNGGVHLNYRQTSTGERYFIGFTPYGIYLNKTKPPGNHINLIYLNEQHYYGQWYIAEIVGVENNIKVYVNGVSKIDYTDNDPVGSGTFGLETLDNSHIHFDNMIVTGEKPPTLDVEWIKTGGPSGGLGYDVRIHPSDKNIMFVTDNPSGVNKSYDGGDTWVQRNTGISTITGPSNDGIPIFSLTIDPGNPEIVWAGTQNAKGIYKSTDGGETWAKKDNGVTEGDEISFRNFGIHPYNSNIVFAGAEISTGVLGIEFDKTKGTIYKTEDGGEHWRCVWEGDNLARFVLFDQTDPNVMYASTGFFDREAYNGAGVGILKSTDSGETWFQINNGIPNSEGNRFVGFLEMDPTDPQTLFAASGNNAMGEGGVFRTTNGGASWEKVLSDDVFTVVTLSPSNPNVIYAGSESAFYRSDNGGNTWRRFWNEAEWSWGPLGIRAGFPISAVVDPDNPHMLFANNYSGGNFKSTDGGRTWVNSSKGYTGADLKDIAIDTKNPATVYTIGRSGPFRSYNGGTDWAGIAFSPAAFPEWNAVALNPDN